MEEEKNELLNLEEDTNLIDTVKEKDNELIDTILQETDIDKLKDLTHVFNAFQAKRQILRVNALNDVQDALVAQMARRLQETIPQHTPNLEEMSNEVYKETLLSSKTLETKLEKSLIKKYWKISIIYEIFLVV